MTLFWHPAGLKISYHRDAFREWLVVDDLNPEQHIEFSMTPLELLRLGFKCISAACWPRYTLPRSPQESRDA
jgi:hypothetical protein